jgi:hypothetical protein
LTCLYDSKGTPGGPTGLHATLGHYPMPHGIAKVYMRWSAVTTPSCPPRGSPRVRCDRATGGSAVPSQWPHPAPSAPNQGSGRQAARVSGRKQCRVRKCATGAPSLHRLIARRLSALAASR